MVGRPRTASDEAIFEAVAAVVNEHGPAGLTLGAVAERVGLSAPALTQRFGSKRGLLVAFAAAASGSIEDAFDRAVVRSRDPVSAVRTALLAFAAPAATRRSMANNLAFLQLDLTDPELAQHAATQSRAVRRRIASLLRQALDEGLVLDVAPEALADTVYTTYNGALITWAIDGRGPLARWIGERLDRVLAPYLPAERGRR